jgi:hypothetical protein
VLNSDLRRNLIIFNSYRTWLGIIIFNSYCFCTTKANARAKQKPIANALTGFGKNGMLIAASINSIIMYIHTS